jgi:cysteinyl-tRNA synthetase
VNIRLYDSKARGLADFVPREPGKVGMYVCGPTVQSSPHIGHLRSALAYDLWRRWFTYRGLDVTFVRNVTDIDDVNASEREPWWAVAYRVELEFTRGYNALGILPPTYEPRATASIPGMQELIAELIDKGNAYVADDGHDETAKNTSPVPSSAT